MILLQLHSSRTLRNVLRASPAFRDVATVYFDEILTAITIKQVTQRGFDPFGPHNIIEVCLNGHQEVDEKFRKDVQAFQHACQQHKAAKSTQILRIPATVCRSLLHIRHAVPWLLTERKSDLPTRNGRQDRLDWVHTSLFQYMFDGDGPPEDRWSPPIAFVTGQLGYSENWFNYSDVLLGDLCDAPEEEMDALRRKMQRMWFGGPAVPSTFQHQQELRRIEVAKTFHCINSYDI